MTLRTEHALTRIVVLAKEPAPGRSKTRLTPPYTPQQAAVIARACLQDTLQTMLSLTDRDPSWDLAVCLDGGPGPWLPPNVAVVHQRPGGHDERIAGAFEDCLRPPGARSAAALLLIGMDTPHITADHLRAARKHVRSGEASLGPAADGGWWLLGLPAAAAASATERIVGVPTSTPRTGDLQQERLRSHGMRVRRLARLRDIDTASDLHEVAAHMSTREAPSFLVAAVRHIRADLAA